MTPGDAGMDSMSPVIGSSLALCTVAFAVKNYFAVWSSGLDRTGADNQKINFLLEMLAGGEAEGNWLLPDVLVSVSRGGDEVTDGVVKEVLPVACLNDCELCCPNVFIYFAVLILLKIGTRRMGRVVSPLGRRATETN
jgi:hypothetical protein